jgi:cell shape-determining protein MreD
MKSLFVWVSLLITLLLQSFFTTMPLVVVWLSIFYVLSEDSKAFFLAFLAGIILDSSSVRHIGISSLFLVGFVFLVSLYEKKFETQTLPFVGLSSFLGTISYSLIVAGSINLWQVALTASLAGIIFYALRTKKEAISF